MDRPRGIEVPPLSRRQIRSTAHAVRQLCSPAEKADIVGFLECTMPTLNEDFSFEVVPSSDLHPTEHARTYPDQLIIVCREDVYERACDGKGRDRMTLAHELGHLILHDGIPLSRQEEVDAELLPYRTSEWQADCFGGEFLVLPSVARKYVTPAAVAGACGVSVRAAKIQLRAFRREALI